jgi:hypothetical protein
VTASSGEDPTGLLNLSERRASWRSDGETIGAWVQLTYAEPTRVDRVRLLGPGETAVPPTGVLLLFDGGASLLVTPDEAGDAVVQFPERTVSRVRMTVASVPDGAESVGLAGFSVDGEADDPPRRGASPAVVGTTSSGADVPAAQLTDGSPAVGDTGDEWTAAEDDESPWAALSWDAPREIASVQVFGPSTGSGGDDEPLSGVLRFDDGSSVRVSSITTGDEEATTVAFAPRVASGVRLELERPTGGVVGLRELVVHEAGTTPPRWPRAGDGYAVEAPDADDCDTSSDPVAEPEPGQLTLVCPAPGSAVDEQATVVVAADPGARLEASAWTGVSGIESNAVTVVATATADEDGLAVLTVDVPGLPSGPLVLAIRSAVDDADLPLYVQLFNRGGRALNPQGTAPQGMTLQWTEDFNQPVSVTDTGAGADYAARKPDASSSGQFGDAEFSSPGSGTVATLADEFLRIRTKPDGPDSATDGTENIAGMLASTDVSGAGFAAQYGYFETRILGAPGLGTWPAFWMLDTESAARVNDTETEVDAVELYGHNPLGSCHTIHNWGAEQAGQEQDGAPTCIERNGFTDWALAWHTYAVRIVPNAAVFSIDGQVVSTVEGLAGTSRPLFFLVNLALGGGWPIDLSATGGVSDMYVDWVHVYT